MPLIGKTIDEKIWNYLKAQGLTDFGAAGLMGNLQAESGLRSTNLQNSFENAPAKTGGVGYTDASYTVAVDSGAYAGFVSDRAGYGLAQWTYPTRKQALLNFVKTMGRSIGDLEAQLGFLVTELAGSFPRVLAVLKSAASVQEASDCVLLNFERPADQSQSVKNKRAEYGQAFYDKFADKKEESKVAKLTPNVTYKMNGVTISEKIIPDGTRWKDAAKAKKAGFSAGALYKKQQKLSAGTGRVQSVTIHNTNDLANVYDDGEQYTRATYNENMNSSRVHFYVDDTGAWQNLKAGTGLCSADPVGSAEVSWHSGDGSVASGGNMTSLSMEIIMGETPAHDEIAKDNGARIAAWLLWKNGLSINNLVTHTYWVNKSAGKTFADVDEQCCNPISGKKWCPTYIFGSNNKTAAMKNWKAFKALVKKYLDTLNGGTTTSPAPTPVPPNTATDFEPYKVRVTATNLNIRKGAGTNFPSAGYIKPGVYTIVEEADGKGATRWGKLKSGMGWISLDYAKKV